jgi:hypothetical protein
MRSEDIFSVKMYINMAKIPITSRLRNNEICSKDIIDAHNPTTTKNKKKKIKDSATMIKTL